MTPAGVRLTCVVVIAAASLPLAGHCTPAGADGNGEARLDLTAAVTEMDLNDEWHPGGARAGLGAARSRADGESVAPA